MLPDRSKQSTGEPPDKTGSHKADGQSTSEKAGHKKSDNDKSNRNGNGRLYLIPTPLGPHPQNQVLPEHVIRIIHTLDTFFVERIRQANSFLRWIHHPIPDFKCRFHELNKHTPFEDLTDMMSLLKKGAHAGIISEAGCPAVADPGSELVRMAHTSGIQVTPLTGPSSILLALMASGLNGQAFRFHGYLPRPGNSRTDKIRQLQKESSASRTTQIFMETPYRNNNLLDELKQVLPGDTLLCVASNLTLPDEQIITQKISSWKQLHSDLHQKPSIFLLLAGEWDASDTCPGGMHDKKHTAPGETGKSNLHGTHRNRSGAPDQDKLHKRKGKSTQQTKKKPAHNRKRAKKKPD